MPLAAVFIAQHSLLRRPIHQVFGSQGRQLHERAHFARIHVQLPRLGRARLKSEHLILGHHQLSPHARIQCGDPGELCLLHGTRRRELVQSHPLRAPREAELLPSEHGRDHRHGHLRLQGAWLTRPLGDPVAVGEKGLETVQRSGLFRLLLFAGLSMIPQKITLGDVLMRVAAGIYLRRSIHFKRVAGALGWSPTHA